MSEELDRLRHEMTQQFNDMRTDIKEISTALLELVRLDGKFNSLSELLYRVATQADALETRLRQLENKSGVDNNRISNAERMVWVVITGLLGLAFAGLKTGFL